MENRSCHCVCPSQKASWTRVCRPAWGQPPQLRELPASWSCELGFWNPYFVSYPRALPSSGFLGGPSLLPSSGTCWGGGTLRESSPEKGPWKRSSARTLSAETAGWSQRGPGGAGVGVIDQRAQLSNLCESCNSGKMANL